MKKFMIGLFIAVSVLTLSSCADEVYIGEADEYVITYGTPYYEGNIVRYYIYGGQRYYPSYGYYYHPYRYRHTTPPPRPRPRTVVPRRPSTPPSGGHGGHGARPTPPRRH